ncbi:dihydrolipoyl dehydrogenase [Acinetobacter sp. NCu2D-2]|uniref:dihydrolipoyl dehydrogenase n=1 Tax=Acinetobacter sp. NCu2D-2 TaxID=1608473 RepID=UPI0007CDBECC|nr:dihydrolipoyl dehydrogenase [Acinetobacter sp. NCu2D-2]ANF82520.1 dihydrolipoyl dehydrogenase [Acinetobacter sp. NCu2D-2]
MYDLIIIGAGTAGISAYKEAIKYTNNLLIINDGPWDTTCARVGCMPSKVLIASANRAYEMQHFSSLGLSAEVKLDTSQVMQHVQQLRDRFTKATLKDVDSWKAEHKISGRAEFIDEHTVQVGDQQFHAKTFIIAVGSTPNIDTNLKQQLKDRLITTDQIFELKQLPTSLAVIGSGVIAIELAQAMHRLGVLTDIFARSRKVGSLSSPDLQKLAQEQLSKELNLHFETLPDQYHYQDDGIEIQYTDASEAKTIKVEYVLTATGRKSRLNSLKLENINAEYRDLKSLPVDAKTKQLANYSIYIAGDAHTTTPIQHEAAHEGRMLAQMICKNQNSKIVKILTPLGIMFSSPEMAAIGKTYKQLTEEKIEFVTGYIDYSKQGRSIVNAKNQGAAEIYVDKTSRKVLGAELFCYEAEHLAHLLAWMIAESLTIDDLLNKPFYHPTVEEGLRTALKHARRQLNANE